MSAANLKCTSAQSEMAMRQPWRPILLAIYGGRKLGACAESSEAGRYAGIASSKKR